MIENINNLTDSELQILAKYGNIEDMLVPIKSKDPHYSIFRKSLGIMNPKSDLVKKNLPIIAVRLYKRNDPFYVNQINGVAERAIKSLRENVQSCLRREISDEEIAGLNEEELVDLLRLAIEQMYNDGLDWELVWVQFKLIGCSFVDDQKNRIKNAVLGIDSSEVTKEENSLIPDSASSEGAELNEVKEAVEVKKVARSKKTPQEKAEQSRAAMKKAQEKKAALAENKESSESKKNEQIDTRADLILDAGFNGEKSGEDKRMSFYVGKINIRNTFYNFTPVAFFDGDSFLTLTERELDELLPMSQKQNINFTYNIYDQSHVSFMDSHFYENQLVVLNSLENLEENRDTMGNLNPTGYKVPAVDWFKNHKIRFLSDEGFYAVKPSEVLLDSIEVKKIVRVAYENLIEGEKILIRLEGLYAGPFEVKYSPTTTSYFIRPEVEENKYTIAGYEDSDCEKVLVSTPYDSWNAQEWTFINIKKNAEKVVKDVIDDKTLLMQFKNAVEKDNEAGMVIGDVEAILNNYRDSLLVGERLPEEIGQVRMQRLQDMLSSGADLTEIYANIADVLFDLILKNKDDDRTIELIEGMFEKRPEMVENVQSMRVIQDKVEIYKQELEKLELQRAQIMEEINESRKQATNQENIEKIKLEKNEELTEITRALGIANEASELQKMVKSLSDEKNYLEQHKSHLVNDTKSMESRFVELLNNNSNRIADISFDGFIASKMLQAAADWEKNDEEEKFKQYVSRVNSVETETLDKDELVAYFVDLIQRVRPEYNKNTIINLLVCTVQGFLTVFSGTPGCGKTSICNIIAKSMGVENHNSNRYVSVSVERGWTSKRDFIGYYNPLTKAFEESNREVFDGLRILNLEAKQGYHNYPFIMLLDEANLSPMEYYWADFMNVCDDLKDNHEINLGNDNIFTIPETLHFLATINNDHTTETLSPRLIDRAWVITLPNITKISVGGEIEDKDIRSISWKSLRNVFGVDKSEQCNLDGENQRIFEELRRLLNQMEVFVSPRVSLAIRRYCRVASELMEEDEFGNSASVVALDFAVAQKILPKLVGAGEEYEKWLETLFAFCNANNLEKSAGIVRRMIERGNRQMKYYQFFN